jgi:hypothetical protein
LTHRLFAEASAIIRYARAMMLPRLPGVMDQQENGERK